MKQRQNIAQLKSFVGAFAHTTIAIVLPTLSLGYDNDEVCFL